MVVPSAGAICGSQPWLAAGTQAAQIPVPQNPAVCLSQAAQSTGKCVTDGCQTSDSGPEPQPSFFGQSCCAGPENPKQARDACTIALVPSVGASNGSQPWLRTNALADHAEPQFWPGGMLEPAMCAVDPSEGSCSLSHIGAEPQTSFFGHSQRTGAENPESNLETGSFIRLEPQIR